MQVDFLVAFEGTEMLAYFLDGVTDQSKEISNRKRISLFTNETSSKWVYELDESLKGKVIETEKRLDPLTE